jgi:lipoprotein-anchoring transpeptidase ErfK/SrfK
VSGPSWYDQIRDPNSSYYTAQWDGNRSGSPEHHVTINQAVLNTVTPSNSRLEIDLREQKARLYKVEGDWRMVSLETPISTGREGYRTPSGEFTVLEKLADKKSTLYGSWVDRNTGALLEEDGDSRHPPSGGRWDPQFNGAPMPNWLRLTNDGIGMHIGYVPEYPASHGCIRVPRKAQDLIYQKVRVGTPVTIRH